MPKPLAEGFAEMYAAFAAGKVNRGQPLAGYRRGSPERTVLHVLAARHAQTMLAELRDADPEGGGIPRYVKRELAAYLKCGVVVDLRAK